MVAAEAVDFTSLAQYGVLGLVVLGFIFGKIVPGYVYERRLKEVEERDAKIERMTIAFEEKAIPALLKASDVLEQAMKVIQDLEARQTPRKRTP